MLRDLRELGFTGNYATVLHYLNRLRDAQPGAASYCPRTRPGPPLVAAPKRVLTPRIVLRLDKSSKRRKSKALR